ncbi:MAG: T9SS type A sorting domain-containing protein, partial [Bacteroidota bacterium]
FSTATSIYKGERVANELFCIDVDEDGFVDILAGGEGYLYWFKNNNGIAFNAPRTILYRAEEQVKSIAHTDLDADGDIDLIAVVTIDDRSAIYLWKKTTVRHQPMPAIDITGYREREIQDIELIDIDNDGLLDIAFTGYGQMAWVRNEGNFNFSSLRFILQGGEFPLGFSYHLYAGDIDGDNIQDLYLTNSVGTYWLQSDGNGHFSPPIRISDTHTDAHLFDMDNDGDLDIVGDGGISLGVDRSRSQSIRLLENKTDLPKIRATTFWDRNENLTLDTSDTKLEFLPINVAPDAVASFIGVDSFHHFHVEEGKYELSPELDSCWLIQTDSSSYTVTATQDSVTLRTFGLSTTSFQATQSRITSAPTRCGFEVPFWISVQNTGCAPSRGIYGIVLDELVTFVESEIEQIEQRGDTLLWSFTEMEATRNQQVRLLLRIAGTDFIGDTIRLTGLSYFQNEENELVSSGSYTFESEIRCAYDPNDKLVEPDRSDEYEKNYTLFNERLIYTIHFQNTGTDTAFNVRLFDLLDKNLDLNSIQPIAASHYPFRTSIAKTDHRYVIYFDDILLPDSTTNEPLSHGFFTFSITATDDLPEETIIENKADIYFDFNPAIRTNTIQNVMVEKFPITSSIDTTVSQDFQVNTYPNPADNQLTFELSEPRLSTLYVYDATGKLIHQSSLTSSYPLLIDQWNRGVYFYSVLTKDGRYKTSGRFIKL